MGKSIHSVSLIIMSMILCAVSFAGQSDIPVWLQKPEKQNSLNVIIYNAFNGFLYIGFIAALIVWFWGLLESKEMIPGDPEKGQIKIYYCLWAMAGFFAIIIVSRILIRMLVFTP